MSEMNWISNRELAIIVIGFLAFTLALMAGSTRKPAMNLVHAVVNPVLVAVMLGIAFTAALTLVLVEPINGWSNRQIWLSAVWLFTVALPISFGVVQRFREAHWSVVLEEVLKAFSTTFFVDMIANYASFSFLRELLFVGFLAFFTTLSIVAIGQVRNKLYNEQKESRDNIVRFSNWVYVIAGLIYIIFSILSIYHSPEKFFNLEVAINFSIPFLLTSSFTVYLCALFIYVSYQDAFTRISFYIKDYRIEQRAKIAAITSFGANVGMLKHWLDVLAVTRPKSDKELESSLRNAYLKVPLDELEH